MKITVKQIPPVPSEPQINLNVTITVKQAKALCGLFGRIGDGVIAGTNEITEVRKMVNELYEALYNEVRSNDDIFVEKNSIMCKNSN